MMFGRGTGDLMLVGFCIGLIVALVLFLGDQVQPVDEVWTPRTVAPPVTTEVDG